MNNFLDEVVQRRREQLSILPKARRDVSPPTARPHCFRQALAESEGANIIAEFKRASPSKGVIKADASVTEMVSLYENAGACALSILTEPSYFRGSLDDLRAARKATRLPILQKDFIVDEIQIGEAAETGADAILLIVAALTEAELLNLRALAEDEIGLDALVEVHNAEEMRRAVDCGASLIGVNNRDLRTLTTSLETSLAMVKHAPAGSILVSESGISSPEEIESLRQCGYRGFLIGESLMRAADPVALIRSLRGFKERTMRHV